MLIQAKPLTTAFVSNGKRIREFSTLFFLSPISDIQYDTGIPITTQIIVVISDSLSDL